MRLKIVFFILFYSNLMFAGDYESIRQVLIQNNPETFSKLDSETLAIGFRNTEKDGANALHFAISNKLDSLTNYLITLNLGIEVRDFLGRTPFMMAVSKKIPNEALIEQFIASGASPMHTDIRGRDIIFYAQQSNNPNIINKITDYKKQFPIASSADKAKLKDALATGNMFVIYDHFQKFKTIDYVFDNGTTLQVILKNNCLEKISLRNLIKLGLNVNFTIQGEGSPLLTAITNRNDAAIIQLIQEGARTGTYTNANAQNAIILGVINDVPLSTLKAIAQKTLLFGIDSQDIEGNTALIYAAIKNKTETMKMLVNDFHANPKIVNKKGMNALMYIAQAGNLEGMNTVLSQTNPSATDIDGNTALHYFAKANPKRFLEALSIFIKYNAATNITNKDGLTPYGIAIQNGMPPVQTTSPETYDQIQNALNTIPNTIITATPNSASVPAPPLKIEEYNRDETINNKDLSDYLYDNIKVYLADIRKQLVNDLLKNAENSLLNSISTESAVSKELLDNYKNEKVKLENQKAEILSLQEKIQELELSIKRSQYSQSNAERARSLYNTKLSDFNKISLELNNLIEKQSSRRNELITQRNELEELLRLVKSGEDTISNDIRMIEKETEWRNTRYKDYLTNASKNFDLEKGRLDGELKIQDDIVQDAKNQFDTAVVDETKSKEKYDQAVLIQIQTQRDLDWHLANEPHKFPCPPTDRNENAKVARDQALARWNYAQNKTKNLLGKYKNEQHKKEEYANQYQQELSKIKKEYDKEIALTEKEYIKSKDALDSKKDLLAENHRQQIRELQDETKAIINEFERNFGDATDLEHNLSSLIDFYKSIDRAESLTSIKDFNEEQLPVDSPARPLVKEIKTSFYYLKLAQGEYTAHKFSLESHNRNIEEAKNKALKLSELRLKIKEQEEEVDFAYAKYQQAHNSDIGQVNNLRFTEVSTAIQNVLSMNEDLLLYQLIGREDNEISALKEKILLVENQAKLTDTLKDYRSFPLTYEIEKRNQTLPNLPSDIIEITYEGSDSDKSTSILENNLNTFLSKWFNLLSKNEIIPTSARNSFWRPVFVNSLNNRLKVSMLNKTNLVGYSVSFAGQDYILQKDGELIIKEENQSIFAIALVHNDEISNESRELLKRLEAKFGKNIDTLPETIQIEIASTISIIKEADSFYDNEDRKALLELAKTSIEVLLDYSGNGSVQQVVNLGFCAIDLYRTAQNNGTADDYLKSVFKCTTNAVDNLINTGILRLLFKKLSQNEKNELAKQLFQLY